MRLGVAINQIKGFLDPEEGAAIYASAVTMSGKGACLEVGSYCGKSTVYFGAGCKEGGGVLFAVDHHNGSEENQPGEEYHDPDLYDPQLRRLNSFPEFRRTLIKAQLEDVVVPIVAKSGLAARAWTTPLAMLFIDGGHSMEAALSDYRLWTPHVMSGGLLLIHDVFPNPADGGRPPYEIYKLATISGQFEELAMVKSLALLRRLGNAHPRK
jgi:hypothetical protein